MTLDELKEFLRKSGIKDFNVVTNEVGPTDEWTTEEQLQDCCQELPNHDPCVEDGKVEPWYGWTDELKQDLGYTPKPGEVTVDELFANAERAYGKGNVHLKVKRVGPNPCGEKVTKWVDTLSCCTDPSELLKYTGQTTASSGDTKTYSVQSGSGEVPITWWVIGVGATVAKADATSARAEFDDCFCKPVVVYAQDTCESVAPWVVSKVGGSWSTIDDENLPTPFGWFQDGTLGSLYLTGFNDDNTKVSTQHYTEGEFIGTKEVVCGSAYTGINEDPIVTPPSGSQVFEKCEEANIWVRLKEGYTNIWDVRWAIDSQSTLEFSHTCIDEPAMEYDTANSTKTLDDDSSGPVYWLSGTPPFTVTVTGVEIFVDSDRKKTKITTSARTLQIYFGDSCGVNQVTVADACGASVTGIIKSTSGSWYRDYTNAPAGVLGAHPDDPDNAEYVPPRDGYCPALWYDTQPALNTWYYEDTGQWRIQQQHASYCNWGQSTQYYDTPSDLTALYPWCEARKVLPQECISPTIILEAWRYGEGASCFDYDVNPDCRICGNCQGISAAYTGSGFQAISYWNGFYWNMSGNYWRAYSTLIDEWRC